MAEPKLRTYTLTAQFFL